MNALRTPSPEQDAADRAFRTLMQGLSLDVAIAAVTTLSVAIAPGIEWTKAYGLALAGTVAKSAVLSVVSYAYRKLVPPIGARSVV